MAPNKSKGEKISPNKKMERETRFELATFALARQRSTTEPLPHKTFYIKLVRMTGLEPAHRRYQILSLARLPFRHIRLLTMLEYYNK